MSDPDSVRASDREREAAVERSRAPSVEGRLTLEELARRTEEARRLTNQYLDAEARGLKARCET